MQHLCYSRSAKCSEAFLFQVEKQAAGSKKGSSVFELVVGEVTCAALRKKKLLNTFPAAHFTLIWL